MTRRRATRDEPQGWTALLWQYRYAIGLGMVLLLAAVLRFWGLGRQGLWWDEIYSLQWSQKSFSGILDVALHRDNHPPTYYFLLHVWMQLFGSGDASVRSLSAVCGVAGVGAAYLLGRAMFRPGVGLAFAALVSVSEFHLYYSQEARSYALLFAASILSMHAYWRLFHGAAQDSETGDPPRGIRAALPILYYVAATALLLYTHNVGLYVVAAQALHRGVSLAMKPAREALMRTAAAFGALALVAIPWVLLVLRQMETSKAIGSLASVKGGFDRGADDYTVSGTFALFAGTALAAVLLWVLVANALLRSRMGGINRERNPDDADAHVPYPAAKMLLLVAWLACSALLPYFQSVLLQPVLVSRILIPALAPFLLLAAVGICRLQNPAIKGAVLLVTLALFVPGILAIGGADGKEHWREAVGAIEAGAAPNATVVLVGWQAGNPYVINGWFHYSQLGDLHAVPGFPPENVANLTRDAKEVWLLSRDHAPCGAPDDATSQAIESAAAQGGRHETSCNAYQPKGLDGYPLAGDPIYVHHFTA